MSWNCRPYLGAGAASDYHLLVEPGSLALSTEDPVQFARPSIDVMFETAADAYGERAIGIILTGANNDGAAGLAKIKERGGIVIVIAHRPRALFAVDTVGVVQAGKLVALGPKEEILKDSVRPVKFPAVAGGNSRAVAAP